jgi:hypothetical protein
LTSQNKIVLFRQISEEGGDLLNETRLSIDKAAGVVGVNRRTILQWASDGIVERVREDGRVWIVESSLWQDERSAQLAKGKVTISVLSAGKRLGIPPGSSYKTALRDLVVVRTAKGTPRVLEESLIARMRTPYKSVRRMCPELEEEAGTFE